MLDFRGKFRSGDCHMPETRIEDVPALTPHAAHLKSLGYRTTDQLVGAAEVAGDLLAQFLKTDRQAFAKLMLEIPSRPKPKGIQQAPKRVGTLGVRLDRIPRPRRALMMSAPAAEPL